MGVLCGAEDRGWLSILLFLRPRRGVIHMLGGVVYAYIEMWPSLHRNEKSSISL